MHFRPSSFAFRLAPAAVLATVFTACQPAEETGTPVEPYEVSATLSTNRITLGDVVRLEFAATHPPAAQVMVPDPAESKAITVRDRGVTRSAVSDELAITQHEYRITSFKTGTHHVWTGRVEFVVDADEPVTRPIPDTVLEVVSLLDDETEIAPIRPPLAWPSRIPRWVPVLAGIAVLALALGLIVARVLRKPRTILQQAPPRPAHETALNALRMLRDKQYIESGQVDPFYTELSGIVRRYLEDRFQLRAPESTTEEFIRDASETRALTAEQQAHVRSFLEQSDLVKFARFRPDTTDMRAAFDAAERLIRETQEPAREETTP